MKKTLKKLALITIGVVIGRVSKNNKVPVATVNIDTKELVDDLKAKAANK